jgi:lysophospholipase L1-like esterase
VKNLILVLFLSLFFIACSESDKNSKLYVVSIGDSTVETQDESRGVQGWSSALSSMLNSETVYFKDLARSGSSSKSFYERFWSDVLKEKPDIILVQFGHNDVKLDDRFTDAETTYKDYLRAFKRDADKIGAQLIFITPPERLKFDIGCQSKESLKPYVESMREVATETDSKIIDLWTESLELNKYICQNDDKTYFTDITHTTKKGSKFNADFIYKNLITIL